MGTEISFEYVEDTTLRTAIVEFLYRVAKGDPIDRAYRGAAQLYMLQPAAIEAAVRAHREGIALSPEPPPMPGIVDAAWFYIHGWTPDDAERYLPPPSPSLRTRGTIAWDRVDVTRAWPEWFRRRLFAA